MGGLARAAALSAKDRKKIASAGAAARWLAHVSTLKEAEFNEAVRRKVALLLVHQDEDMLHQIEGEYGVPTASLLSIKKLFDAYVSELAPRVKKAAVNQMIDR